MQSDDGWDPFEPVELPPPPPQTKRWAALAAVVLGLLIATLWIARPPADRLASDEALLSNFERIAFGPTNDLRVWQIPLRIAVTGVGAARYRDEVMNAATLFESLTGIDAQLLLPGTAPFNLQIDLVPEREYGLVAARLGAAVGGADYLAEHTLCYTVSATAVQEARLQHATVVIPNHLSEPEIRACIWHELLHAFGFQSHPEALFYSALREARQPTRNDLVLLRTLYDPRLGRGGRAQILANARVVLAEHAATARVATDPRAALTRR